MQRHGLKAYQNVGMATEIMSASPHRLIQMLLEEALKQLAFAKNSIEINDVPGRCKAITKALDVILTLRASLNREAGGELAKNLYDLYEFIEWHLVEANLKSSIPHLDEIHSLICNIKEGWDGIAPDNYSPTTP